ncbi:MAG TPA: hypothetical protein VF444_07095 [Pseudonocardiaceae bacterium]
MTSIHHETTSETAGEAVDESRHSGRSYGCARVCALCGHPIPNGTGLSALLPDSSVIDPHDPSLDGRRPVFACGGDHLDELIARAQREWIDEELWFGQLCRASVRPGMCDADLTRLGQLARLSDIKLRRALEWNAGHERPCITLPGGQPLPVVLSPRPLSEA